MKKSSTLNNQNFQNEIKTQKDWVLGILRACLIFKNITIFYIWYRVISISFLFHSQLFSLKINSVAIQRFAMAIKITWKKTYRAGNFRRRKHIKNTKKVVLFFLCLKKHTKRHLFCVLFFLLFLSFENQKLQSNLNIKAFF